MGKHARREVNRLQDVSTQMENERSGRLQTMDRQQKLRIHCFMELQEALSKMIGLGRRDFGDRTGAARCRRGKDGSPCAEGDGCCWRWRHLEGGISSEPWADVNLHCSLKGLKLHEQCWSLADEEEGSGTQGVRKKTQEYLYCTEGHGGGQRREIGGVEPRPDEVSDSAG